MKNHRFDHEKLDVYQLELQFIAWLTPLIETRKASSFSPSMGSGEASREYFVEDEDEHEDDM